VTDRSPAFDRDAIGPLQMLAAAPALRAFCLPPK
jgi:hypothetical protein